MAVVASHVPNLSHSSTLPYVEWLKAKAQHRASAEDREFLANRVRRLRDEQRSIESHIANAKERIAAVEETRAQVASHRTAKAERQRKEEEQLAALQREVSERRRQLQRDIETARQESLRSHSARRGRILQLEDTLERAASARRSEQAAQLARRREAIRRMEKEAAVQRRLYLEERRAKLQQEHARNGTRVLRERDENVRIAGGLVVLEADLMRQVVDLRRDFRREGQKLATLVTPKPPGSSPSHAVPRPPPGRRTTTMSGVPSKPQPSADDDEDDEL